LAGGPQPLSISNYLHLTLIKKKIKFSSNKRKSKMEQL
jgi:hypothetical protein